MVIYKLGTNVNLTNFLLRLGRPTRFIDSFRRSGNQVIYRIINIRIYFVNICQNNFNDRSERRKVKITTWLENFLFSLASVSDARRVSSPPNKRRPYQISREQRVLYTVDSQYNNGSTCSNRLADSNMFFFLTVFSDEQGQIEDVIK